MPPKTPARTKFKTASPIPETGRLKSICLGTSEVFKLDPRWLTREPGLNTRYDFGNIESLADDIAANGIQEALKVRKVGPHIHVINGDRRLTAIEKLMGEGRWPEDPANPGHPMPVPCTSEGKQITPADRIFMMLSLNTGKPFTLLEKGLAYRNLLETDPSINQSEIARRTGETKQAVSNAIQIATHASPEMIEHIKSGRISATTALDIIKSTSSHEEQDSAASQAIDSANSQGRTHATPKDLPKKPKASEQEKSDLWRFNPSSHGDFKWSEFDCASSPNRLVATPKEPFHQLMIDTASYKKKWFFGVTLRTSVPGRPSISGIGNFHMMANRSEQPYKDEPSAVRAAWDWICATAAKAGLDNLGQPLIDHLIALGHELSAKIPTGTAWDASIFARQAPDPTADSFIADLSDESDPSEQSGDSSNPSHQSNPSQEPPSNPDAPADPSAYDRLKSAPSSNRDGSSGGPGEGFAAPEKRLKKIEELLDSLVKEACHEGRWETIELILDYLNGNHTVATIRKHLSR